MVEGLDMADPWKAHVAGTLLTDWRHPTIRLTAGLAVG